MGQWEEILAQFAGKVARLKETLIKSRTVMPAKAGIQEIQGTGPRPSPGWRI